MRKIIVIVLVIIIALLAACAQNAQNERADWVLEQPAAAPQVTAQAASGRQNLWDISDSADMDLTGSMLYGVSNGDDFNIPAAEQQRARHIIRTAWTELETEYFDDIIAELRTLAPTAGGYVELEQLAGRGNRTFNITLRIPVANFDNVLAQIENLADVRSSRQHAEDVTDQFYDTAARLETRRIEEERLLALIEEADNVHDLLELERRLSMARLQIETYESQLTILAGRIAYSTIFVSLFDIAETEYIPAAGPALGERVGGAFGQSVDSVVSGAQSLVIFLAGIIIPLVIWCAIGFGVFKLVKWIVKRAKAA